MGEAPPHLKAHTFFSNPTISANLKPQKQNPNALNIRNTTCSGVPSFQVEVQRPGEARAYNSLLFQKFSWIHSRRSDRLKTHGKPRGA
jgi:hypothetical protein